MLNNNATERFWLRYIEAMTTHILRFAKIAGFEKSDRVKAEAVDDQIGLLAAHGIGVRTTERERGMLVTLATLDDGEHRPEYMSISLEEKNGPDIEVLLPAPGAEPPKWEDPLKQWTPGNTASTTPGGCVQRIRQVADALSMRRTPVGEALLEAPMPGQIRDMAALTRTSILTLEDWYQGPGQSYGRAGLSQLTKKLGDAQTQIHFRYNDDHDRTLESISLSTREDEPYQLGQMGDSDIVMSGGAGRIGCIEIEIEPDDAACRLNVQGQARMALAMLREQDDRQCTDAHIQMLLTMVARHADARTLANCLAAAERDCYNRRWKDVVR